MDSAVRMRERFRKDESKGLKVNIFGVMFSKVYGKQRKSLLSEESGHSLEQVSSELELNSWGACGTGGGRRRALQQGAAGKTKARGASVAKVRERDWPRTTQKCRKRVREKMPWAWKLKFRRDETLRK